VAAFLANVGVNAGHPAWSPLHDDGSFDLLPIPEALEWRHPMLRYRDLPPNLGHVPSSWANRAAHLDPDLNSATPTYGDNCRRAARAFTLRRAKRGDLIVFLARLKPASGPAAFYLVGCLDIEAIASDLTSDPGTGWWDANAHVRRSRASGDWDSFWVFHGGPCSLLFDRPVPFTRRETSALLGDACMWPDHRTELQTIGSYTRTVRRFEGAGEEWLRAICRS